MKKICNKCLKELPKSNFALQKLGKDGYRASCKECVKNTYLRTKYGLVKKMLSNQRAKSKKRNHPLPSYTFDELYQWCMSQELFHTLYDTWVSSGYQTRCIPTCDRLDDYKPYTLSNIQLLSWQDNICKYSSDARLGKNTKTCRTVLCFDLQGNFIKEYYSISEAGRAVGTGHANIRNVCEQKPLRKRNPNGTYCYYTPQKCMGFIWRYKDE